MFAELFEPLFRALSSGLGTPVSFGVLVFLIAAVPLLAIWLVSVSPVAAVPEFPAMRRVRATMLSRDPVTVNEKALRVLCSSSYSCAISVSTLGAPVRDQAQHCREAWNDVRLVLGDEIAQTLADRHRNLFSLAPQPTNREMEAIASDLWSLALAAAAQSNFASGLEAALDLRLRYLPVKWEMAQDAGAHPAIVIAPAATTIQSR